MKYHRAVSSARTQTAHQSRPIRAKEIGLVAWICLNWRLGCHGSRIQMRYASSACFRTWGGSSERSFLNRLVVREVTVQVHWLSLPGLELAKRFVCQIGKRVLGGGECRRPTLFCIEFGEKKRSEGILLRVGELGGCGKGLFEKLSHLPHRNLGILQEQLLLTAGFPVSPLPQPPRRKATDGDGDAVPLLKREEDRVVLRVCEIQEMSA